MSGTHKLRTISGTHKSRATEFCTRGAYCGGSLELKLLHVILLAPRIFEVDPEFFWKIYAPLFYVIAIMESYYNDFF